MVLASAINHSSSTKLLGVTIADDQKWKSHFEGKGGLNSNLNQRYPSKSSMIYIDSSLSIIVGLVTPSK